MKNCRYQYKYGGLKTEIELFFKKIILSFLEGRQESLGVGRKVIKEIQENTSLLNRSGKCMHHYKNLKPVLLSNHKRLSVLIYSI